MGGEVLGVLVELGNQQGALFRKRLLIDVLDRSGRGQSPEIAPVPPVTDQRQEREAGGGDGDDQGHDDCECLSFVHREPP